MSDATNTKPEEAAAAAAAAPAPVDTKAGEATAPASDAAPSTAEAPAEKQDEAAASTQEESVPPRRRLDDAERLMALKQWEQAADEYAQALDGLREEFPDEHSPQLAPVLHRYGRSLLEHAIATSGALGGGGGQQDAPMPVKKKKSKAASGEAGPSSSSASASKPADPRFSFSGDADDDDEEEEEDEAGGQAGEEEDEDDLSVAFAVLDLARIIYQKLLDSDASNSASLTTIQGQSWNHVRIKNELAEVLNDLGDVGLETENFQQASSDYETSLQLLSPLLHPHSRRLADAYLRLGLALEFHPEDKRQAEAPNYVQSAANTLRARLDALKRRREILQRGGSEEARSQAAAAQLREEKAKEESAAEAGEGDAGSAGKGKGKGKEAVASEGVPAERDDVAEMDEPRVERELKDVEEMIADLDAKLEDSANNNAAAAAAANGAGSSSAAGAALPDAAKQALQQAINEAFLGASTNSLAQPRAPADGPVNDLSGMVRKKKRPAAAEEEAGKGKGKEAAAPAGQAEGSSTSKKARVEDEAADA